MWTKVKWRYVRRKVKGEIGQKEEERRLVVERRYRNILGLQGQEATRCQSSMYGIRVMDSVYC